MPRRRILPPDVGPSGDRVPARTKSGVATEHDEARAALIERNVVEGVTAGIAFKALVAQVRQEFKLSRAEAEDAVRRAEEHLRTDMLSSSQQYRAASVRRVLNVARDLYLNFRGADLEMKAKLSSKIIAVEERLAKMLGWDEPERLHVQVTGPSDRFRKAMENFDDEEFLRLAAEEDDRQKHVALAREHLGLPPGLAVVAPED